MRIDFLLLEFHVAMTTPKNCQMPNELISHLGLSKMKSLQKIGSISQTQLNQRCVIGTESCARPKRNLMRIRNSDITLELHKTDQRSEFEQRNEV